MVSQRGLAGLQFSFNKSRSDSDSEDNFSSPTSPDADVYVDGSNPDLGCRVSRRLGTVWSRAEPQQQGRPRSAKAPRHISFRMGRIRRGTAPEPTEPSSQYDEEIPNLNCDPSPSGSDSDEDVAFILARDGFTDPCNSDDTNCLNCFAAYSAVEFWSIDMRLTLLWCLAYEARYRRHAPALELWLAIIEGSRERVDWCMWEDGDEAWLRNMIVERRMSNRFRVAAAKLGSGDWARAREALGRRIARPRRSNSMKTWSTPHRVLRIAWCAVTDGFLAVGKQYLDLMKPINAWTYFTCPLRPSYDQDMKPGLHDRSDCSLSSCKVGVWQWFRTAILDYDMNQIQNVMGCCSVCVSRAFSTIEVSSHSTSVEEPAIWPVILWVAFQVQTRYQSPAIEAKSIDALLALIESNGDQHKGLWSWDNMDENILRQNLISSSGVGSSWIDRYPYSWRKYILLLDSTDWKRLAALTRQPSRPRSDPLEYDAAIRVGAIVLWASSNCVAQSPDILLALDRFLAGDLADKNQGFLRCLLEGRVPTRANHYELNLGPDTVDWHDPQIWLDRNRVELRSSVLHDPDTISFVDVVENVYMVYHVARALPLRFMASVFSCLLKKFRDNKRLDDFRAWINIWKTWDVMTCLINFRSVLAIAFETSKLIEEQDLPKSLINVVIHTDIRCICAQFAVILRDPIAYQDFLKAQNEHAQKLLDVLQDLLDYPLLDAGIRPVILKALLKLSTKSGRHPRCFALSDLQLDGHQVAAGSFGDVWKARVLGETVSVKIMRVFQEADVEALLKEFYDEALIWRQLSHPNLLPFFGVYYLEDAKCRLGLVSPWMESGNIARYLKTNPVGINRLTLVLDVALGLEHLHNLKLVHGDLKAINVLVTRSGRAVLADFGLSSVTDSKILQLSTSTVKIGGTVRWQAPELFRGNRNSFASDVYAFSCVCYEIFTGSVPFYELTNDVAVMFHVMEHQRPSRSPSILDDVWNLMMECWKTEPAERPSADQIVFRLRDRPIGAMPTDAASDWDPWYTSKFRSSLEEHTLFLSCGKIDDWLQFTQPENSGIQSPYAIFSAREAIYLEDSEETTP